MKQKIKKEKGQVVLMVLLASALVLTLGLSASRITTTETKIDTDQELLKRAFNTAESGIDYYLATGDTNYSSTGSSDGAAELKVSKLGDVKTLSFNTMSLIGSYEYFWLVNHDASAGIGTEYYSVGNSTVDICSINPSVNPSEMGSLKIDYFYLSGGNYGVGRTVMPTGSDGCVPGFNISSGGLRSLLLVVTPINKAGKIEIRGTQNFPIQGEQISSTGKIEGVNNTVTVLNRYDVFLTEGIVSGGDVTSK